MPFEYKDRDRAYVEAVTHTMMGRSRTIGWRMTLLRSVLVDPSPGQIGTDHILLARRQVATQAHTIYFRTFDLAVWVADRMARNLPVEFTEQQLQQERKSEAPCT